MFVLPIIQGDVHYIARVPLNRWHPVFFFYIVLAFIHCIDAIQTVNLFLEAVKTRRKMEAGLHGPLSQEDKNVIAAMVQWINDNPTLASYGQNTYQGVRSDMILLGAKKVLFQMAEAMAEGMDISYNTNATNYKDTIMSAMQTKRESWGISRVYANKLLDGAKQVGNIGFFLALPPFWKPDMSLAQIYAALETRPAELVPKRYIPPSRRPGVPRKKYGKKNPDDPPLRKNHRPRAVLVEEEGEKEQRDDDNDGGGIEPGGFEAPGKEAYDFSMHLGDEDFEKHALPAEEIDAIVGRRPQANMQSVVDAIMESMQRQEAKMDAVMHFLNVPHVPALPTTPATVPYTPPPAPQQQEKPASPLPEALHHFAAYQPAEEVREERAAAEESQFQFPAAEGSQQSIYDLLRNDSQLPSFHFSQQGGNSQ
jgi:hypothetical protein